MIKAIFWDNDGVLVDKEGLFFRANQEILAVEVFSENDYFTSLAVIHAASDIASWQNLSQLS